MKLNRLMARLMVSVLTSASLFSTMNSTAFAEPDPKIWPVVKEAFFAQRPLSAEALGRIRLWSTGPGTRSALVRLGIAPERMDSPPDGSARFDSEALWDVVAGQLQPGERVLVVRGHDGDGPPPVGGAGRDCGGGYALAQMPTNQQLRLLRDYFKNL